MDFTTDTDIELAAGSAPYYLVRFAPANSREHLALLFRWFHEMERLLDMSEAGVALTKLHWWLEELERLAKGEPRHPLTQGLAGICGEVRGLNGLLTDVGNAFERHISINRYRTPEDLLDFYRGSWGSLSRAFDLALGQNQATPEELEACGSYYGAVDMLRRLGAERVSLRPRLLESERLMLEGTADDPETIEALVSDLCSRADSWRPKVSMPQGLFNGMVRLTDRRLREIRRSEVSVLDAELDLTPLRLLWIVWRA